MENKRKIYWSSRVPDELKELLADTDTVITQQESERESCNFRLGGTGSNLHQNPVNWEKVKSAPVAFFHENLLEWDIPKLILKRFFAGEGGLGPEESYQGVVLKSNSIKILDSNSLGYFSDILTATATELRINPVKVRSFCVLLLSYLDYLKKSELVSFPIEVDYGLSQDSFFIQIHCENHGVFLENLVDATGESDLDSPLVSLIDEAHKKADLMEVYTLKSSNKLVFTACWVGNPHFIRKDFFNGLIIHQVDSFKAPSKKFGKVAEAQTFHKETIENISKVKVAEKLPQKYKKQDAKQIEEVINPVLVKRMVRFVTDKNKGRNIDWKAYQLDDLKRDYQRFPDKEALKRINSREEQEILKVLAEGEKRLEEEVANVKKQIDTDDYLSGILNSLNNMSLEEVMVAADLEEESEEVVSVDDDFDMDLADELQKIQGAPEDLTEETQKIQGAPEDLTEEIQKIQGVPEDLTEEIQRIQGTPEDLAEELQRINGEKAAPQFNEKKVIKGVKPSQPPKAEKQIISGESHETKKQESFIIKGQRQDLKEDTWQVKRLNVVKKVEEKVAALKADNATHEEIDQQVKQIISSELNLDEEKSQSFVQALSDDVSDDFLHEGIDTINENIKNRIRIEKLDNQLQIRDKQVEKMKILITGLKSELASTREELLGIKHPKENIVRTLGNSVGAEEEASSFKVTEKVPDSVIGVEVGSETKIVLQKLRGKDEEITALKQEVALLKDSTDEEETKEVVQGLKSKNLEMERENEKLSNQVHKLERDNELLLKKFREGVEEVSEIRDSDEDVGALKAKNENLEAQVESMKKKLSFLYENSKSNKEIELSANEVQKIIEDKERFFNEKMKAQEEIDFLKSEVREKDRVLKQKELELNQKSDLLKNKPVGEAEDVVKQKDSEIGSLKIEIKKQAEELKSSQLKTKSLEQKMKFLNVQLEKYQSKAGSAMNKATAATDNKIAAKLKQAEIMNKRLKDAADKYKNELGEKKTELHKAKLEAKTMELKIKDLEKKLLQIVKKKAA